MEVGFQSTHSFISNLSYYELGGLTCTLLDKEFVGLANILPLLAYKTSSSSTYSIGYSLRRISIDPISYWHYLDTEPSVRRSLLLVVGPFLKCGPLTKKHRTPFGAYRLYTWALIYSEPQTRLHNVKHVHIPEFVKIYPYPLIAVSWGILKPYLDETSILRAPFKLISLKSTFTIS